MSIVAVVRPRRSNHFSEYPGMSTWKIGCVMPAMICARGKVASQPRISRFKSNNRRRSEDGRREVKRKVGSRTWPTRMSAYALPELSPVAVPA